MLSSSPSRPPSWRRHGGKRWKTVAGEWQARRIMRQWWRRRGRKVYVNRRGGEDVASDLGYLSAGGWVGRALPPPPAWVSDFPAGAGVTRRPLSRPMLPRSPWMSKFFYLFIFSSTSLIWPFLFPHSLTFSFLMFILRIFLNVVVVVSSIFSFSSFAFV